MADESKRPEGWFPLFGEFETSDGQIKFNGGWATSPATDGPASSEIPKQAKFGLLLNSRTIADGTIAADIQFEKVSE